MGTTSGRLDPQAGRGLKIGRVEGRLSIGEFAASVGLTVSALRFYDDTSVLKPAQVDRQTGYRYYSPDQIPGARLLRQLRAAGMPLPVARQVLAAPIDQARRLIDDFRQDVERRLEEARSSASAAIELLDSRDDRHRSRCTVDGDDLKTALTQILHATPGKDSDRVPDGVLLAIRPDAVRLVATDGARLAMRDLFAQGSGEGQAVLHAEGLRRNLQELPLAGTQMVEVDDGSCRIGRFEVPVLDMPFPAYERILPDRAGRLRATFEVVDLRRHLQEGDELAILSFAPGPVAIAFNRDFLLQALEAANGPDVLMESEGPESPCLIRSADDGTLTYLLMPIRISPESPRMASDSRSPTPASESTP